MKRIFWVSVLLVIAGLLLPLVFLSGGKGYSGDKALSSPPPQLRPSALPNAGPLAEYKKDSDFEITVLIGGEPVKMSMAEYLPRAVAAEMPVSFEAEALRAQSVAARTYVVYGTEHQNPKHPEADVCTDYRCCLAYLDDEVLRANWGEKYEENMETIVAACQATDGQVLRYNDAVILATFHSSSAGLTEAGKELWGNVPYLASVSSPETADDVPNFVTTVEVTPNNLKDSIKLLYPETVFDGDPVLWVKNRELDESGRVRKITIGSASLTGSEVRKLFALRSAAFTLEYNGAAFVFTVTGFGHGLGMSQYGANVMARNGFTYKEILAHYYPNTKLG